MDANTKEYKGKPSNRWILVYRDEVLYLSGSYRNAQEVEDIVFRCQYDVPPLHRTIRKLPKREYHPVADYIEETENEH